MKYIKVLIALLSITFLIGCATDHPKSSVLKEQEKNHFYFIQITDTHWGDKGHLEKTQKAVELINNLPLDITMCGPYRRHHNGLARNEMIKIKRDSGWAEKNRVYKVILDDTVIGYIKTAAKF